MVLEMCVQYVNAHVRDQRVHAHFFIFRHFEGHERFYIYISKLSWEK
jgi:hypothetical protein